jgi:undecaprenyl diphosphate synthase
MTTFSLPHHVAIIPDGNRRWAKEKGLSRAEGHLQGYTRAKEIISFAHDAGIHVVTIWAFSTENWKRTEDEVSELLVLIKKGLSELHTEAIEKKTRVVHIGRRDRLGKDIIDLIDETEMKTKEYDSRCLCIAIDYGGEDELARAENLMRESNNTTKSVKDFLDTSRANVPPPDFIIRTSGEKRTSGFMPLQSAYAEWFFTDVLFPDFGKEMFQKALNEYGNRNRRFGK